MTLLHVGNKKIEVDQEGFLCETEEWNEEVARALAEHEGIDDLDQSKLDIVLFLREYFQKHHSFPILRYVCKNVHAESGSCMTDEFINPMKAWKIAGLPKPPQIFFTSFDGEHYAANPFY
jgi:TusE/DsrC/DsvC family sulfur relay protein